MIEIRTVSLAAPEPGEGGWFSVTAERAIGGAAQSKPACPIVLRKLRRVGELTHIGISISAPENNFISTESKPRTDTINRIHKMISRLDLLLIHFNFVDSVHSV